MSAQRIGSHVQVFYSQSCQDVSPFTTLAFLQRIIGKLYRPHRIRNWLRLPPSQISAEDDGMRAFLTSVFIISAPLTMVKVSIFAFLIGLGVYQGFTWTRGLDTNAGKGDSRDVFITFMVGMGLCFVFFLITFAIKNIETLARTGWTGKYETGESGLQNGEKEPQVRRGMAAELSQGDDSRIDDPTLHEDQGASRDAMPVGRHDTSAGHRGYSPDKILYGGLIAALNAAAQAHLRCAEADRQVALEYVRASNADRSDNTAER